MENNKSLDRTPKLLAYLGITILIVTLILSFGVFNAILNAVITSQTQLKFNSDTWNQWKDIPIPAYLRIRFFNITNPDEFSKGEKPILVEVGPYVYREHLYKQDIIMDESNDTVKYRPYRDYFFEPKLSNGTEDDVITMINIPFVAVAKLAHELIDVDYIFNTLDEMITSKGEKLLRKETVHDILWGFSVKTFVDLANSDLVKAVADVELPKQIVNGKMGILQGKNQSDEGWFEVRTGKNNYEDFGRIVSYNHMNSMNIWNGDSCNQLNGTDGIIFPPYLFNKSRLYVLVPDMCRSIPFELTDIVEHDGIPGMRFRQPKSMYQTPQTNLDNLCFCPKIDNCQVNGLLNIEPCLQGAPIYASQPHMLFVDEKIRNLVIGLNPDIEKHWGYMDLYPVLGITLEAKHRIQFNLQIQNWDTMPTFSRIPNLYLPILWIEEGATLTGTNKTLTKLLVLLLSTWAIGKYILGIFGGIILPGIAYYKIQMNKKKKNPSEIFRHLHLKTRTSISHVSGE